MNMKWKKGKAKKEWVCILDGKPIAIGEEFIRPHHQGLNFNSEMSHGMTFRDRPPCFHLDCFKKLGNWFGAIPPVYNNAGEEVPL